VLLLLTIVSVLALWALLGLLVLGLLLITKPLEGARENLRLIAAGVRAIEHQVAPLGQRAGELTESLLALRAGLDGAAFYLAGVAAGVHAARDDAGRRG
jgi:hypothetical protein